MEKKNKQEAIKKTLDSHSGLITARAQKFPKLKMPGHFAKLAKKLKDASK